MRRSPKLPPALILLLGLLLGCDRPLAELPAPPPGPELVFEGVTLRVYRRGAPQLRVRASQVELMRSSGALAATDARFEFYVDALTLQAPALVGNLDSLSFDATGGVTLASADPDPSSGFVATAPRAHFEGREGARGIASGAEPIAVRGLQGGRPFSLDAHGFRFDVDAQHASFDTVRSTVGIP